MFWDGHDNPSVRAPLGDFFGVGHAVAKHYVSLPMNAIRLPARAPKARSAAAMNTLLADALDVRPSIRNESDKGPSRTSSTTWTTSRPASRSPKMSPAFTPTTAKRHPMKVMHTSDEANPSPGTCLASTSPVRRTTSCWDTEGRGHSPPACGSQQPRPNASNQQFTWPGEATTCSSSTARSGRHLCTAPAPRTTSARHGVPQREYAALFTSITRQQPETLAQHVPIPPRRPGPIRNLPTGVDRTRPRKRPEQRLLKRRHWYQNQSPSTRASRSCRAPPGAGPNTGSGTTSSDRRPEMSAMTNAADRGWSEIRGAPVTQDVVVWIRSSRTRGRSCHQSFYVLNEVEGTASTRTPVGESSSRRAAGLRPETGWLRGLWMQSGLTPTS